MIRYFFLTLAVVSTMYGSDKRRNDYHHYAHYKPHQAPIIAHISCKAERKQYLKNIKTLRKVNASNLNRRQLQLQLQLQLHALRNEATTLP
jgi:hypothetical protein